MKGRLPVAGYYLFYFATVGVTLPFLPPYLKSLGLDATQVGALLALSPLLALLAPSLWGHAADRRGRPDLVLRVLSLGACLAFAPLALGLRGFGSLAAVLAVWAFFNSAITAIIDGIAIDRVKEAGGSFAHLRLWGSLGFVLASTLFGRFVSVEGRGAVLVPLVLMAAYAAASFAVRSRTPPPPPEPPFAGLRLLARRDLLLFLIASALHWIGCAPYHGMFAIHVQALGLPMWVVGVSAGLGVVAEVAVMALYPRLGASARHALALAFLGSAVRWMGMAWATGTTAILCLSLLHGLTFGAFYVASIAFVSQRVPDALRARGQALFASFTFGLGGLVGYLGAGAGYDRWGGHALFAAAAAVEMAALLFLALARDPPPVLEAA